MVDARGVRSVDDGYPIASPRQALFWSALDRLGIQSVQLGLSIIMARILMPSDYGLIGMIALYVAVAGMFVDGGFSATIVQRQSLEPDEIVSVFYLNIAVGLLASILLCAISPWLSSFYHQPSLLPITRVMGVCVLIGSFGVVPAAILYRRMDLRRMAQINFIATPLSGVAGIASALCGYGVWSLIVQQLVASALTTALSWWYSQLRLRGRFRLHLLRTILPFSLRIFATGLSGSVSDNLSYAAIGKLFRPADVGFYTRAFSLARLPMDALDMTLGRVFLPMLSRLQAEVGQFTSKTRRYLEISTITVIPIMSLLAVVSAPLVSCLLTEKWSPCVPYLRLFCLAAVFWLWQRAHINILTAKGLASLLVRMEMAKRLLQALVLAATIWYGMMIVVVGQVLVAIVGFFFHAAMARRSVPYSSREQCRDLLPSCFAGALVAAVAWGAGYPLRHVAPWFRLGAETAAGTLTYALAIYAARNTWAGSVVSEMRKQMAYVLRRRRGE